MDLLLALDHKFHQHSDGSVWAMTMFGPEFFARYLEVFERVTVVARLRPTPVGAAGSVRVDSSRVQFAPIPYYEGPLQYAMAAPRIDRVVRQVYRRQAVVLRVPQTLPLVVHKHVMRRGAPYGVEVVADPWDLLSPGSVRHPLRPYLRWQRTRSLTRICRDASGASYVTESMLQERYPPGGDAFTIAASSIELRELADAPRPSAAFAGARRFISVGAMNQLYKAQDILVRAFARVRATGGDVELVMVGDGAYRPWLTQLTKDLGVSDHVRFVGELPSGRSVSAQLDQADLFVLPSRQEGLPRAAIEAMSRGLPVILSDVGGNRELVPRRELVAAGDIAGLAAAMASRIHDCERLAFESERNWKRSAAFLHAILSARRRSFYEQLRDVTLSARPLI